MYTWSRHVMSHVDYYVGYLCRMFPLLLLVQLSHISHTQGKSPHYYLIRNYSQKTTVIPVPKPGKDRLDPNNYWPIALTTCLCKIMVRMINHRLTCFLQDNNIITKYQCGFQKRQKHHCPFRQTGDLYPSRFC